MKALTAFYQEIYFKGNILKVEFEEYKTLWHAHIIDRRRYFSFIDTLTFRKSQKLSLSEMLNIVYNHCLNKHYFLFN